MVVWICPRCETKNEDQDMYCVVCNLKYGTDPQQIKNAETRSDYDDSQNVSSDIRKNIISKRFGIAAVFVVLIVSLWASFSDFIISSIVLVPSSNSKVNSVAVSADLITEDIAEIDNENMVSEVTLNQVMAENISANSISSGSKGIVHNSSQSDDVMFEDFPENCFKKVVFGEAYAAGLRHNGTVDVLYHYEDIKWFMNQVWGSVAEGEMSYFVDSMELIEQAQNVKDITFLSNIGSVALVYGDGSCHIFGDSSGVYSSEIDNWENIEKITEGPAGVVVGLTDQGQVVTAGEYEQDFQSISKWTGLTDIVGNPHVVVGLKEDGTVVYYHSNYSDIDFSKLNNWNNVVQIDAADNHIVALRSDGSVVTAGKNNYGECNVYYNGWESITQISASVGHTVGLRRDGTVIVSGANGLRIDNGQRNVQGISGAVWIGSNSSYTFVAKRDGSILQVGNPVGRYSGDGRVYVDINKEMWKEADWRLAVDF